MAGLDALLILLVCLASFISCLAFERIYLNRCVNRIPLRIAVTGTRGKSSVARILASILTEHGKKVVAKTTGSQAMMLLPDGSRRELRRRGTPSILEQKQAIRQASRVGADCLIAEIMSIHPENHRVEAQRILMPNLVAVTNVRLDHTEAMGRSADEIASVLSLAVPPNSCVFLPEQIPQTPFAQAAEHSGCRLARIPAGSAAPILERAPHLADKEFPENLDLVYAVARHLNIDDTTILNGILKSQFDIGKLKVWRVCPKGGGGSYYLANAFAANDPESTLQILSKLLALLPAAADRVIGILNLRADRLPRTLQWIDALERGALSRLSRLYVTGDHTRMVKRRLPEVEILEGSTAESLMTGVTAGIPDGSLVFGFGNIKGAGMLLAEHWSRIGEDYGI